MLRTKIVKVRVALLAILITGLTFSAISFKAAQGSPAEPVIYVDPPKVEDLPVSKVFQISVKVANITDFYGLDLEFRWDPTILTYINRTVTIPVESYPGGVLHNPVVPIKDEVNSTAGTYWLAKACMLPAPPFDGSGTVFKMFFHVKAIGKCTLELHTTELANTAGEPIPHSTQHGYFDNYTPSTAKIYVDPKTIINSSLTACQNFTTDVDIQTTDLKAFEFRLSFNETILEATNVTVNSIWPSPTVSIMPSFVHVISGNPINPVTGTITLATITFHVLDEGESTLDLKNVTLTDKYGGAMPYKEPEDGYFNNMLITRLFVYPPEIIDPTKKPGDIFDIEIKIENAINMYGYEFKLGYDKNVLICLGAIVIPPTSDTHFHVEQLINDTVDGFIWVKVSYYPPAEPITIYSPKTITRITFDVRGYGQTVLDLHDTKIVDQLGNPISHETEDGFFACIIRDVAVVGIEAYPRRVYPGRIVNITAAIANLGDVPETFNVTAYYNDHYIETKTVTNLASGENCSLVFTWNTTGLKSCLNYTIKAEAEAVPYEMDLSNNIYTDGDVRIKMLGDINGDDKIDIYDVTLACSAYGSHEGDPTWNPEADLAPEWGIINIYDLVTLASRYGQTCGP